MDSPCPTQEQALAELERTAPGAPFLALGQTVFWDEPMKAGVALRSRELGYARSFVAGVHDTDYFAKLSRSGKTSGYEALPHNDTTTRDLWSAAGEFSALFGSETVVTRDLLQSHGGRTTEIQAERPGYLDELTEAWGWRGIVSNGPESRITAEKPIAPLMPVLFETFRWAVEESLALVAGPHRTDSERAAEALTSQVCDASCDGAGDTLSDFFQRLLPVMYRAAAGQNVELDTTRTTELLKFNRTTCSLPRFELFRCFVEPETRPLAVRAYDDAIRGSEVYTLDRFGAGALPFDLFVPGHGRGTLRIGNRGGVVMSPEPVGFSFKKPPQTLEDLAGIIEDRFGPDCVLIGKAVTLIGMLGHEFVFVFHEGASSYVTRSRDFHRRLADAGLALSLNPVLRVDLEPWDALDECCAWFRLPEPMRRPFGVDETSGRSLATRWKEVVEEQKTLLDRLKSLRRPLDLVRFLDETVGGRWNCLARCYENLHEDMLALHRDVESVRAEKAVVLKSVKDAKRTLDEAESAKGRHWRDRIFEKDATPDDLAEREAHVRRVAAAAERVGALERDWRDLQARQDAIVSSEEATRAKETRKNMAFEAELARVKLIREAVMASVGMVKAGHRPSAWWFPLVCPDGSWFRATSRRARYRLEPLI
ncbi:MAG: hypothetical protein JST30_02620 [Armatimonadetes bacterium]|nr:hypothetical protein [Armatimonadota bacterium]